MEEVNSALSPESPLKYLITNENQITYLGPQCLSHAPYLCGLYLDDKQIHSISQFAFENQSYLYTININYNQLKVLDLASFIGVGTGCLITFSHNHITNVIHSQPNITAPTGLDGISLAQNRLKIINLDEFIMPIDRLDLQGNSMIHFNSGT